MTSLRASFVLLSLFLATGSLLEALPRGAQVHVGAASLTNLDEHTLEISSSERSSIHWDEFSIGAGEVTRFVQPGGGSVVLNRVVGGNPSEIFGRLEANGKVFLINPNGIFVGSGGVINVGAFVASTLDCLDGEALAGGDVLFAGLSRSRIVNLGRISAWDGDVILMASSVHNGGVVAAPQGGAAVGVGSEILLSPAGCERLVIRAALEGADHEVGIDQVGSMEALQVELKSKGNPYALAIRHRGRVDALAVEEQGGRVFLVAEGGEAEVSGEIVATSCRGLGGEVRLLGDEVGVLETALIDVSGERGGGTVLLGGDFQGSNPQVLNARQTVVQEGARIVGDAYGNGNGGRVFVWSQLATAFYGDVSVQGGPEGGDGGLVALLGDDHFDFRGTANRLAPQGTAGMLILDPTSLTIAERADGNIPQVTPFHPLLMESSSFLSVATLLDALEGGDVIVQSAGGSGGESGDVVVNSELRYDSDFSLTLRSFVPGVGVGDVQINAPITNLGEGGLVLDSCRDINVRAPIDIKGFDGITMTGGRDVHMSLPVQTGGNLTISASEEIDVLAAVEAEGGMDLSSKRSIGVHSDLWASGSGVSLNSGGEIALFSSVESVGQGGIHISGEGNLLIGSEESQSPARIHSDRGTINIVSTHGDVAIVGGSSPAACVEISSEYGPITINATEGGRVIRLEGGVGDGAYATICGDRGSVSLWSGGDIDFLSASLTTVRGNIRLRAQGDVSLQGGSSPARIFSEQGTISVNAQNGQLLAGAASALVESGSRNISINVEGLHLQGGSGGDDSAARIHSESGCINISTANDLTLQGGGARGAIAEISSEIGRVVCNNIGGDLQLLGGSGEASRAVLGQGGVEFYTIGGDVLLQGGSDLAADAVLRAPTFPQEGLSGSLTLDGGGAQACIDSEGDLSLQVQGVTVRGAATLRAQGTLDLDTTFLSMEGGLLESVSGAALIYAKESCHLAEQSHIVAQGDITLSCDQGVVLDGVVRGAQLTVVTPLSLSLGAHSTCEVVGVRLEAGNDIALDGRITTTGQVAALAQGVLSVRGAVHAAHSVLLDAAQATLFGALSSEGQGGIRVTTQGDLGLSSPSLFTQEGSIRLTSLQGEVLLDRGTVASLSGPITLHATEVGRLVRVREGSVQSDLGAITLRSGGDVKVEGGGRVVGGTGVLRVTADGACLLANGAELSSSEGLISVTAARTLLRGQGGSACIEGGQHGITVQTGTLALEGGSAPARIHTHSGPITLTTTGDVTLSGGREAGCSAQIASDCGDVIFNSVGGDVVVRGGTHPLAHALIGESEGEGDILFREAGILGNLRLLGGAGYAGIGQGNLLLKVRGMEGIVAAGNAGITSTRELHIRATNGITLQGAEFRAQDDCDLSARTLVIDGGIIESAEGDLTLHLEEASFGVPEMLECVQCAALQGNLLVKTDAECCLHGGAAEGAFVELLGGRSATVCSSGTLALQGGAGCGADASIAAAFEDVVLNVTGDITLEGGEDSHAFVRHFGGGGGDLTVVGYGDVTLGRNAFFENLGSGELNTFADRDLILTRNATFSHYGRGVLATAAGRDMLLTETSSMHQYGTGNLFIVSGRNTLMDDAFTADTTSGDLTVVVDHFLPGHPVIGDGSFIKRASATLNSATGLVSVYTARRNQNTIEGEINGQNVTYGPEYTDTENEQWLTFFSDAVKTALDFFWDDADDIGLPILLTSASSSSKAPVYVIYYKDGKERALSWSSSTLPRTASIHTSSPRWKHALATSNRIARAESYALQNFRTLSEFLFIPKRFLVSYDAITYFNCCELQNCCPCFNEMLDEYTLLRRTVRTYNTKKLSQNERELIRYY